MNVTYPRRMPYAVKRRNHISGGKAKAVSVALKAGKTLAELAEQLDFHEKQIQGGRR